MAIDCESYVELIYGYSLGLKKYQILTAGANLPKMGSFLFSLFRYDMKKKGNKKVILKKEFPRQNNLFESEFIKQK